MAEEYVKTRVAGFLTMDRRAGEFWDDESDYTEASPYLDVPRPRVETELLLLAGGEIEESLELSIDTRKSGMPGPGGTGFSWRYLADDEDESRGADVYNLVTYREVIRQGGGMPPPPGEPAIVYPYYLNQTAVQLDNGDTVVAQDRVTGSGATAKLVEVVVRSKDDDGNYVWTATTVYTAGALATGNMLMYPSIVKVGSRLLLFHWVHNDVVKKSNIRMWYSDTGGTSWTLGEYEVLPFAISTRSSGAPYGFTPRHISTAFLNGQILMVLALTSTDTSLTYRDILWQFASNSLGVAFDEVVKWQYLTSSFDTYKHSNRSRPVAIVFQGEFVVFYLAHGTMVNTLNYAGEPQDNANYQPDFDVRPWFVRIGTAYDRISTATERYISNDGSEPWGVVSSGTIADGAVLAACADWSGAIYLFGVLNTSRTGTILRSNDGGDTWRSLGDTPHTTEGTKTWTIDLISDSFNQYLIWNEGDYAIYLKDEAIPGDATPTGAEGLTYYINNSPTLGERFIATATGTNEVTLTSLNPGYDTAIFGSQTISAITETASAVAHKGSWLYLKADGTGPTVSSLFAVPVDGRLLLLTSLFCDSDTHTVYNNSCWGFWLGGYANVTIPSHATERKDFYQLAWDETWIPLEPPADMGWTASGSGVEVLDASGKMTITTTSNTRTYTKNTTGEARHLTNGVLVKLVVKPTGSSGSLTARHPGAYLTVSDGTDCYNLWVNIDETGVRIQATDGSSTATLTMDTTSGIELYVAFKEATARAWGRAMATGTNDRTYTAFGPVTIPADTNTAFTTLTWGHQTSASKTSEWYEVSRMFVPDGWNTLATGFTNPDDLFPMTLSADPTLQVPVVSGATIYAVDGPAYMGNGWDIQSLARYAATNMLPTVEPSPRDTWRSTDTLENKFAWLISGHASATGKMMNNAYGLHLMGLNSRNYHLDGYVQGSGWQSVTAIDAATGMTSLSYTRHGNVLVPASAAANGAAFIHEESVTGCVIEFSTGSVLRRAVEVSSGMWTGSSTDTQKQAFIQIDQSDQTDPTSGTINIWAKELFVVVISTTNYTGFRLRVLEQDNYDGYHQIGVGFLGNLIVLGTDESYGWTVDHDGGLVEVTELPNRKFHSRVSGPEQRQWSVAFSDAVSQRDLRDLGDGVVPRYRTYKTGGPPIATVADTPQQLAGMLRRLNGAHTPCAFLAGVTMPESGIAIVRGKDATIYGRVEGPITHENVWKDLTRITQFTIREEP